MLLTAYMRLADQIVWICFNKILTEETLIDLVFSFKSDQKAE